MSFVPLSEIEKIKFYALSDIDIDNQSVVEVKNKETFKNGKPSRFGCYSANLGTTDHSYDCETCMNTKTKCGGHFGKISLPFPVVSPFFKKEVLKWLKIICFNCGSILTIPKDSKSFEKSKILSEYSRIMRSNQKEMECITCRTMHPIVNRDPKNHLRIFKKSGDNEVRIYNHEIEEIFNKVSQDTVELLGKELHPRTFILRSIIVSPVTIRPEIKKIHGNKSNNNNTTTMLKSIMAVVEKLPQIYTEKDIINDIDTLDYIESLYFRMIRDVPAGNVVKMEISNSSAVSISSHLAKKSGRIRKNILGRRTTYMGRSVISGDEYIKIDEVGVPISIAKNIQIPEKVQFFNRDRMMIYFNNKNKKYPGCSKVVKQSGREYSIDKINSSFVLEDGDIIYRDLIDNDIVAMNRAPSLTPSAISGHRVKVIYKGDTLRLSTNIAASYYGGDFDGDAMMIIFPHSILARTECNYLTGMRQWCISPKDGSPSVGVYHDGLIGMFEFTKNDVILSKYETMRMLSNIIDVKNISLTKKSYSSREIVSMLLPKINFNRKAAFYKPEYSNFIKYNNDEINVDIMRGKLISGRLDKKSIGQGVDGSVFHLVYNEYGSRIALDMVYDLQQVATLYLMHNGMTINYDDITVDNNAIGQIRKQTDNIIHESKMLFQKLLNGEIVPPLGTTLEDFYEQQQLHILNLGDAFLKPVFENINTEKNNLFKMIISGSKGKLTNLLQISSSIGQTSMNGRRMLKNFDYQRTCPYYSRSNEEPQNRGFVTNSYTAGVDMLDFLFQSMEARYNLINKSLSTSITGAQNRKSIKNLESLYTDNTRKVMSDSTVIQCLYGSDGIDIRYSKLVKFKFVNISLSKFEEMYKTDLNEVDKKYQNKNIELLLENEYKQLLEDRNSYRESFMRIELQNKNKLISDTKKIPFDIQKIIEDTQYKYSDIFKKKNIINPNDVIAKINELCKNIRYCHYNEMQQERNMVIPDYVDISFNLIDMLIRSILCVKNVIKLNMSIEIIDIIIKKIINTFNKSLIDYGTPCGVITAQSISEPMTQHILDSHHHMGIAGTNVDFLVRMSEILGAKDTPKMKLPMMTLYLKDDTIEKYKMQEIANHIEMIELELFVNSYQIFFEKYKNIKHSKYTSENKMIEIFEKHNPLIKFPKNLLKWCIRLELNKEKIIEKNMKLETICLKLKTLYPEILIINSSENSDNIIMRIYIGQAYFKKHPNEISIDTIHSFTSGTLLHSIIRGTDNIFSTNINSTIAQTIINEDGSLSKRNVPVILTTGTNLSDIFRNQYIDPYKSQTSSIIETYRLFGIEAARNKIIIELLNMMANSDIKHYNIYADVMTSSGVVTSIDKQGIEHREGKNTLLNIGTSHVIQSLENYAINSSTSRTDIGLTAPIMVGMAPKWAANFNKVCLNEEFISNNLNKISDEIDSI